MGDLSPVLQYLHILNLGSHLMYTHLKVTRLRAGEMAYLGAHTALGEDLTSVPSTHVRQVTVACNSSSKRSDPVFWSL